MTTSILNSIKEMLGVPSDLTAFDNEIMVHINSALGTLTQIGLGSSSGFMITGPSETWSQFLGTTPKFAAVKTFVFISVKLIFDTPTNAYVVTSFKETLQEMTYRLNVEAEGELPDV